MITIREDCHGLSELTVIATRIGDGNDRFNLRINNWGAAYGPAAADLNISSDQARALAYDILAHVDADDHRLTRYQTPEYDGRI